MKTDEENEDFEYVPDYESECEVCGQMPCVTIHKAGKLDHAFGMCGPCTFGSASCVDPDEW